MHIDTLMLSRIQFGFTIGFHILFPALNLGLALFLCVMEGIWVKTRNPLYLQICKFWTKIFALTFGMGVVSGIVLSYELGTNFGPFIKAVGGVLGPLFGYEVLSAFFLEAGFLGIMLFGWDRVSPKLHYAATLLVMIGTTISAFWIMSANSWMQFPTGFEIIDGKYVVTDWFQVVFNPTFMPRFIHMLFASYVTTCFVVAGVAAWHLLKQQHMEISKRCFNFALTAALILTPAQIIIGDVVGLRIGHHQPMKVAAMEGLWETTKGAPLVLFALPDTKTETNRYEISIPYLASLINTHQLEGELVGLKSVPAAERPIVNSVFFNFRIMVGIGFLLMGVAMYATILRWRKRLYDQKWFLQLCVLLSPIGFIATIAGWMVAESGRQPWTVYGLIRTAEAGSDVPASQVMTSLTVFIIVYGIVFSFYLFYLFAVIRKGPPSVTEKLQLETGDIAQPFHYMGAESEELKK